MKNQDFPEKKTQDPPTLLIIDDNPEDRELIRRALRDRFQIVEAERGDRGLALAAIIQPACVLLDYYLPDMDGLEFFAARGIGHDEDYVLIVLTGTNETEVAVACMKKGAHDFLTKGRFNTQELYHTIANGLDKIALLRQIKDQQKALQESEARQRLLIDHAPAALAMFDREMRYLAVSQRWCADYRLESSELIGRSHYEIFPEIPEAWKVIHRRGLAGEIIRSEEDRFERLDGSVQWVRWEVCPWRDTKGQVAGIGIFTEDITARKQVELALRESEARLRLAQEMARAGSWEWNLVTQENIWTEEIWSLYGLAPNSVPASYESWQQSIHVADRHRAEQVVRNAVAEGQEFELDWQINDSENSPRWLLARGCPQREPDGQIERYIGIVLDISERKQAEIALKAEQDRFRYVIEATQDGIWDWHLPSGRCYYSPSYVGMLGYAPEELYTDVNTWIDLLHPEEREEIVARAQWLLRNPGRYELEFRMRTKIGGYHWILSRGKVVERDEKGAPLRAIGTHINISERKQLELELQRYQHIVENASEMLLFIDPELRFVMVNPAYARQFQRAPKDFVGRPIADVLQPDSYTLIASHLQAALAGQPQQFSLQNPHRDTSLRDLEITQQPFWLNGIVQGVVVSLYDVTALREAQRALEQEQIHLEKRVATRTAELQASESKLRVIYDLLPVGLAITDPNGYIIDCNHAAEKLLGIQPGEHILQAYDRQGFILVHPDGKPLEKKEYPSVHALREGQIVRDVEVGVISGTSAEKIIWLSVSAMPSPHPDYGVIIVYVEITERKQIETHLQQLANRLQLATEAGAIGIWEWDVNNHQVQWDAQMYALYGLQQETVRVSYELWMQYVHPDDLPRIEAHLKQTLQEGEQVFQDTFCVCWPNGTLHVLASFAQVMRDANGVPQRFIGVNWDITEEQRAASALRASESHARAMLDASPVPLALAHETGAVSYINPAFTETFGYTLEDIPTWTDWRVKAVPDPVYREQVLQLRQERLAKIQEEGGVFAPLEVTVRCKNNTFRTVMARATPLEGEERLNTIYDITELKQAREAAEQSVRIKSEFLAHMSHEIRTPMNAILGLSELALHRSPDPKTHKYLEDIHHSARSLLGILNDVLDQSKLESGRLTLDIAAFNLADLLAHLHTLFASAATAKGLNLVLEIAPAVPRTLLGDALRLRQILTNLLSNALKFTDQGQIQLRVTCQAFTDEWAQIRWIVEDSGIGMDTMTQAQLFVSFTQGDSSIARRFGGTGLGLSISRRLAELMGGTLTVTSQLGVGSVFTLDVRLGASVAVPYVASETVSAPALQAAVIGARILVAEDQPLNQQVICDMLHLLGARVTLANHGGEALELLTAESFDAVLMDIQMPRMDGITATQRIRENPAWVDLPVIALTAGVTEIEREQMRIAGMSDLLPKPVTLDTLRATLGRWLHWRTGSSPPPEQASSPVTAEPDQELEIPGFDLQEFHALTNDTGRIRYYLHLFAETIRDDVTVINTSVTEGKIAAAMARTHRLKGSAGLMGATELFRAAQELEQTLRIGADPTIALTVLSQAHTEALARIAALPVLSKSNTEETAPISQFPDTARTLVTKIYDQLVNGLLPPRTLLTELEAMLPIQDHTLVHTLRHHLNRFDYLAARHLLKPFMDKMPISN